MSKLILSNEYVRFLPFQLAVELKEMPEAAQYEFEQRMSNYSKSALLMYLAHLLSPIPFSLGYVGKWLQQFLFWITGGGLMVWWFIMLFTIPGEVRRFNRRLAHEVFREISKKYGFAKKSNYGYAKSLIVPKALDLPEFDPTMPTLEHLKEGFLFDLEGKTWQVTEEYQLDAEKSERIFICRHDLEEKVLRYYNENFYKKVVWEKTVNIFQIDPELEKKIRIHQSPANILYLNGHRFYKELQDHGTEFRMNIPQPSETAQKLRRWNYINEERDVVLTIISYQNKIKAFQGKMIDENEVTEILPYNV